MNPSMPEALQLRDIHMPGPPEFWPPAPGWWIVAAVVLGLLSWVSVIAWRRIKIQRQRKKILDLLEQLEQASADMSTPDFLAQISRLMRQIALIRYPRQAIASLTGTDWLKFLDESGGNGQFCGGPGQVLAQGPYVRDLPDSLDTRALTNLIRDWIKKNTANTLD